MEMALRHVRERGGGSQMPGDWVGPVREAVSVMRTAAIPPKADSPGAAAALELFARLYHRGHALEATAADGTLYRLCPGHMPRLGDDPDRLRHASSGANYRMTGLRVPGAPCIHADLDVDHDKALFNSGLVGDDGGNVVRSPRRFEPAINSRGERRTLLLRVAFSDQPTVATDLPRLTNIYQNLPPFLQRVSSGRMSLPITYNSACTYVIDLTLAQVNDYNQIGLAHLMVAVQAAATTLNPASQCYISTADWVAYKHFILSLPSCNQPWLGVAGMPGNGMGLNGNAGLEFPTVAHELGHNLGLPHAGLVQHAAGVNVFEYGNPYDILGSEVHYSPDQYPGLPSYLAGYQDAMDWIVHKVTYPSDAYADSAQGPAWVANYVLSPIELRIPTQSRRSAYQRRRRHTTTATAGFT
jgi:hypothetical protein